MREFSGDGLSGFTVTLTQMLRGLDTIMRRLKSRYGHDSTGKGRRPGVTDVFRTNFRSLWILPFFVAVMLCSMLLAKMVIRQGEGNGTNMSLLSLPMRYDFCNTPSGCY